MTQLLERIAARTLETGHHPFGFSSQAQVLACPGSLQAQLDLPNTSSKAADEGTFAHGILERALKEKKDASHYLGSRSNCARFEWREEDVAPGQAYLDTVRDMIRPSGMMMIEERLDLSHVVPGCHGTADALIINVDPGELVNIDLKWGRGVPVSAENNVQLKSGLLAARQAFGMLAEIESYRGVIVQPRLGSVSEEVWTNEDLDAHELLLIEGWEEAISENPRLYPGEAQCRFCKAAGTCEAAAETVLNLFEVFQDVPPPQAASDLKTILSLLPMIETWAKAVKKHAMEEALAGREVPGYKLVAGHKGARTWDDEAAVLKLLKKRFRLADAKVYTRKLITPPMAEKALRLSQWDHLQDHVTQSAGKPALVPESDKRPTYQLAASVADFDDLIEE